MKKNKKNKKKNIKDISEYLKNKMIEKKLIYI